MSLAKETKAEARLRALEDQEEDEIREKDLGELGPHVIRHADTKFRLAMLGFLYKDGARLALVYCVILCRKRHAHLPRWALARLADGFEKYMSSPDTLGQAMFGKRPGRWSDPRNELSREDTQQKLAHAVGEAKAKGHRGKKMLAEANAIAKQAACGRSEERLRKAYYDYLNRSHPNQHAQRLVDEARPIA